MLQVLYDDVLMIAEGKHRRETSWKNKNWDWSGLAQRLSVTHRTAETVQEYINADKNRQSEIKDVGGFVGGRLLKGRRQKENVASRTIITLDADEKALGLWEIFQEKYKCAAVVYSTHKHTPENPRLRFIIPLYREVFAEEYEPIARRVAADIGIESFDPTAYMVQQLMYWPSTPKDGEFYYQFQDGEWLDPDAILSTYRDWKDTSEWPQSAKEKEIIHSSIKKQSDPLEKPGIIGAFCRYYTVSEALQVFLADKYRSTESDDRYTYINGSTAGGLVVYEDKFTFSWHGTDPTTNKLCNAFDLVRIHKFGSLDENSKMEGVNAPSYQAMIDLATKDKGVRGLLAEEKFADAKSDFENDLEETDVEVDTEWFKELEVNKKNEFLSSAHNISLILENDPNLKGRLAKDLFEQRDLAVKALPWHEKGGTYPRHLTDGDDSGLRYYLEKTYGITGKEKIADGLVLHILKHGFHPVKEYLEQQSWDGVSRLETVLIDYFGANDTPYVRAVSRKTFTAGVARIYQPGIKFDYMLTLVGEEGKFKSTFFDKLACGWFTSSIKQLDGNKATEQIQGVWIAELQELAVMKRAEVEDVKAFISNRVDRFRGAYMRRSHNYPRQCILVGTTNRLTFLRADADGNRRFWPVLIDRQVVNRNVEQDLTAAEIGQIWAEAKHFYQTGEKLYLDQGLEAVARMMQKSHTEEDPRSGLIRQYLETPVPTDWDEMGLFDRRSYLENLMHDGDTAVAVNAQDREWVCATEIWCEALGGNQKDMTTFHAREIANVMKNMEGWIVSGRRRFGKYGQQTAYQRFLPAAKK